MLNERVLEYGGLLAAGYGLYQANRLHESEQEKARKRHVESIELAKKQHENDMKVVKQTYLLELFNSLEQHFQQLNADLIASSRESERDMFDQRNQSFQTVIVASSVMFSALSTLIVDGILPDGSSYFLQITYSLTSALSFAFLFLSMVLCIELVIRTSSFMYNRGKAHTRNLERAIRDTKHMMKELRGDSSLGSININYSVSNSCEEKVIQEEIEDNNNDINNDNNKINDTLYGNNNMRYNQHPHHLKRENSAVDSIYSTNTTTNTATNTTTNINPNGISTSSTTMMRRIISNMNPKQIDDEFEKHELQIRKYLKNREKLNDPNKSKAFRDFWIETCSSWWVYAVLLFYAGSLNLLIALMIFMWAKFVFYYNTMIGATIAVSLLGFVSVVGIIMVMIMRQTDQHLKKRERSLLNKECSFPINSSYEDLSNLHNNLNDNISNDRNSNNIIDTYTTSSMNNNYNENSTASTSASYNDVLVPPLPLNRGSMTYQALASNTPPISMVIQDNYTRKNQISHDNDNNDYKTLSDIKSMDDIDPDNMNNNNNLTLHRDIERGSIHSETTLDSSIIYKKQLKQQQYPHNNNLNIDINNPDHNSRSRNILKSIGKSIRKITLTPTGTPQQTPVQTPNNEKKTHRPFFSVDNYDDDHITPPSPSSNNISPPAQLITSNRNNHNNNTNNGSATKNNSYRSYLSNNTNNLISLKTYPPPPIVTAPVGNRKNLYKINSTSTISTGDKNQCEYDNAETNGITF